MSNDTPDEYYDFVNTAYWRTCSLLMEETVRKGFPDRFIKWVASTRWSFGPIGKTHSTLRYTRLRVVMGFI